MMHSRPYSSPARVLSTLAVAGVAVFGLSACNDDTPDTSGGNAPMETPASTPEASSPMASSSATPSASSTPASSDSSALTKAGETAMAAVDNSTLISIETEADGTWEVQVVTEDGTEHEMYVSEDGTQVVSGPFTEDEDAEDKAKHQDRVKAMKLDYKEAADKILAEVENGRITELNIDTENGTTVWESDVIDADGAKRSVSIDAGTGEVVSNKAD